MDVTWERRELLLDKGDDGTSKNIRRAGCASTSYQNRYMLIFGGRENGDFFLDCWSFDTHTGALIRLHPGSKCAAPRAYPTVSLVGNIAWIVGGSGPNGTFEETRCFNVAAREWTTPRLR